MKPDEGHPIVARFVNLARRHYGLTQKDLAKLLNISPQKLSNWKRGTYKASAESIVMFSLLIKLHLEGTNILAFLESIKK